MMRSLAWYVVLCALVPLGVQGDTGYFWHVTDFHYDLTYWTTGLSCNGPVPHPGKYGDYWCDAPWALVEDSVASMAHIKADVDFVLWTGDNVAHIHDQYMTLDKNLAIMQNVTSAINASFPAVPVYASLGNHDFYPSDQADNFEDEMYRRMANMWEAWIGDPAQIELFRKGGYYSKLVRPKLRLLALNTVLYLYPNHVTENVTDPAGQFAWMIDLMTSSRKLGEKVMVTAHVPPGLLTPGFIYWFHPQHHIRYMQIMLNFSDVITIHHYGHDHSDGFKILQDPDGGRASAMFTAPSVTPWRYKIPYKTGDPHNPGVRLVEYDRITGQHINYQQFYINLTDSNRSGSTHWTVLYDFQSAYNVPDMSVESLRKIYDSMKVKDSQHMLQYCRYLLVSNHTQACTPEMQGQIWCGGQIDDLTKAKECVQHYIGAAPPLAGAPPTLFFFNHK